MLKIPAHILKKLQCFHCDNYLSKSPIVLNGKGDQICARCFEILPKNLKSGYVRQIGLEAVAELLIFPCRYKSSGCCYTFQWNKDNGHEANCFYRSNTLPLKEVEDYIVPNSEIQAKITCDTLALSEEIRVFLEFEGIAPNQLFLENSETNEVRNPVRVNFEAIIAPETPSVTCSHIKVTEIEEPIYESLSFTAKTSLSCVNCKEDILKSEIFHCVFGHSLCRKCKANVCVICGQRSNSEAQSYCKYYSQGCTALLCVNEVWKHEIDCEFRNFQCPSCFVIVTTLPNLREHLINNHKEMTNSTNNRHINQGCKDESYYFFCYNKIFHFKSFVYDETIEFIVEYMGSNDYAKNYKYQIRLTKENPSFTKSNPCFGWNEIFLNKAITLDMGTKKQKSMDIEVVILVQQNINK